MPKYIVKKMYHDVQKRKTYVAGETVDLTAKRADEIIATLGKEFLEKEVATKAGD